MKIYFAGSIRGGRVDAQLYYQLIERLQAFGEVLTEHVGNKDLDVLGEQNRTSAEIYKRDVAWIHEADVIVAEVTQASLGVGYELGLAESLRMPVICLYRERPGKKLSAMVEGNSYFKVGVYKTIDEAIDFVKQQL